MLKKAKPGYCGSSDRGSSTCRSSYTETALSMDAFSLTDTASLFGIHSTTHSEGGTKKHSIKQPDADKYDFVIAVAQGSINSHFNSLWKENERKRKSTGSGAVKQEEVCLAEYTYTASQHDDMRFFHSKFKVPRVELPSKEDSSRAIFRVSLLDGGYVRTLTKDDFLDPSYESSTLPSSTYALNPYGTLDHGDIYWNLKLLLSRLV